MGRFCATFIALVVELAALAGCTLTQTQSPTPRVITATPVAQLATATRAPTLPPSPTAAPSGTPALAPSETPPRLEPSATPPVTALPTTSPTPALLPPTLAPTRTPSSPPTVPPLDDGSGRAIGGTGRDIFALTGLEEIDALPETLYYLGGDAGAPQVWRLQWGLTAPEQLSFTPWGVEAYSVAPDGTLAYIARNGEMTVGGLPIAPPAGPDGTRLVPKALAWSPLGGWLAYVLQTPGAEPGAAGDFSQDGVWLRSAEGRTVHLARSDYTSSGATSYTGPITWRPDGTEVLVGAQTGGGFGVARVNILTGEVWPVWDAVRLPPGSYTGAQWSINGNAIITSGGGQVLRVEPDTLGAQPLLDEGAGLLPRGAQQFANGTVTFAAQPAESGNGAWRLYLSAPGQDEPLAVTDALVDGGRIDFLWGLYEQEAVVVAYDTPDALYGTPFFLDAQGALRDLTPILGEIAAPAWGPVVVRTDAARINTTDGEPLNLRSAPGGSLLVALPNGTLVTVLGGPRTVDGLQWWQVRAADGVAGWVAESVADTRGLRLRTLIPMP